MSETVIIDAACRIPRTLLSSSDFEIIKNMFTFKPPFSDKYGFGEKEPTYLYDVSDKYLSVPRSFDNVVKRFLPNVSVIIKPSSGTPVKLGFREDVQAREPVKKAFQDKLIAEYLDAIRSQPGPFRGGLLSASCGSGKSAMALKISDILGVTTLVIVNRDNTVGQWVDEIRKFTTVDPLEIGIVQQNWCEYQGKKIVVAMIQTLISRDYPEQFLNWPGHVVCDEAHHVPSPCWSRVSRMFPAAIQTGITATPTRKDGMQEVLTLTLGKVLAQGVQYGVSPRVYQILRHTPIPVEKYTNKEGKILLALFLRELVKRDGRNAWFVDEMVKACAQGRKIFILSNRRKHLVMLHKAFMAACEEKFSSGLFIGGMSSEALKRSSECAAIFGTYSMAGESVNVPAMDTLFSVTPRADIEQAAGRILRNHEGKKTPVIVDVVDDVPFCIKWGKKRLDQYCNLGFDVCSAPDYGALLKGA